MNRAEVIEALQEVFRSCFFDDRLVVTETTTAAEVDGWDSLSHVRLLLLVEERFDLALPPQSTSYLKNVGELAELVASIAATNRTCLRTIGTHE